MSLVSNGLINDLRPALHRALLIQSHSHWRVDGLSERESSPPNDLIEGNRIEAAERISGQVTEGTNPPVEESKFR